MNFKNFIFTVLVLLLFGCTSRQHHVTMHYLGHAAFYLSFDEKMRVLIDYGQENAYLDWGWNSPIYDAADPEPDIISYSHYHNDHYDSLRASIYQSQRVHGAVDTCFNDLHILGIPSSEKDISRYDNFSYLFTWYDLTVLHLGDCQADIMMINDPAQTWVLDKRYPKNCDILIMPIEGTQQYILQAIKMVELLHPRVLIPMHYWSETYKQEFIEELKHRYMKDGNKINVLHCEKELFSYKKGRTNTGLTVLDMRPSARKILGGA